MSYVSLGTLLLQLFTLSRNFSTFGGFFRVIYIGVKSHHIASKVVKFTTRNFYSDSHNSCMSITTTVLFPARNF